MGGFRAYFGAKVTGIAKVGGGCEGGIKDHSQLLTQTTGKWIVSFTNKKTQGEGGRGPTFSHFLNRNKWEIMKMEGGGAEIFSGC